MTAARESFSRLALRLIFAICSLVKRGLNLKSFFSIDKFYTRTVSVSTFNGDNYLFQQALLALHGPVPMFWKIHSAILWLSVSLVRSKPSSVAFFPQALMLI